MVEEGQYRRAISLLKVAERERTRTGHRTQASLSLLQAYTALGESRAADEAWKRAVRSIPRDNVPMLLGQVAVAAAQDGEHDEAMKWWRRRTNFNRDDRRDIEKMLAAGMREEVLEFYGALAKDDPSSDSPRHVTKYIAEHFQR
jgi:tetratricopeptide (TPR) repeat protein